MKQGKGIETLADSAEIHAEFDQGKVSGKCKVIFADQDFYEGEVKLVPNYDAMGPIKS